ncbi:hypothetical protein [Embleya sp. NBC_00896]|uniref:hypothetical protein n=1 Tax=Embleya sp. NBC_00896 TaxID=2975961 RepID=UPI00386891F6|nr:hypothetical protein OG928_30010 [Embleya sp. NBC_00896]
MRTSPKTRTRRIATVLGTALALALTPTAAFAATTDAPAKAGAGGTAVSIGSGVILALIVGAWAHRRRTVGIALVAFVAGVMLAGSAIALTAAQAGDQVVTAGVEAVSGIFA